MVGDISIAHRVTRPMITSGGAPPCIDKPSKELPHDVIGQKWSKYDPSWSRNQEHDDRPGSFSGPYGIPFLDGAILEV